MEKQVETHEKARNPITHQAHRRDVFWQITLPFILGAAASWGAMGRVTTWANISVIWLVLIMFLPGLILLIILAALVVGVTWLFVKLPEYALQVQNFFLMIVWQVKQFSNKTVEPVLRIESARASLKSIFRK
jgi:hypothetical protein